MDPSSAQDSQAAAYIDETVRRYREAGDYLAAERLYQKSYEDAQRGNRHRAAVIYISGVASCRMVQFRYRAALESYLEAKKLALSIGDRRALGAVGFNLSTLYQQMGDIESAVSSAEEARSAIAQLPRVGYRAELLLQLGRLREIPENDEAEPLFEQGIEAAREQGDAALEAHAWDLLGEQRLSRGRLLDAERAVNEAFRIRKLHSPNSLGVSYEQLGALKLAQGDLPLAAAFTAHALSESRRIAAWQEHRLMHQRGVIRLAAGEVAGALQDFGAAVDLTARWRVEVAPVASSLNGANELLERTIFNSFVETAATEALRTGSARWAAESFQALESNRSVSLREGRALAEASRKKLSPEFWDTLGELRAEEERMLRRGLRNTRRADRLRLRLTEMEAEIGLRFPVAVGNKSENFRSQTSLIHFQEGLGASELLLSFHLGESESFLWAVTRNTLSLHRLPPANRVRSEAREFRDAVREGSPESERAGKRLYREWFGNLREAEAGHQAWLLSVEDTLFELPFAALVTEQKGGGVTYLAERHSIQIVPGAFSLNRVSGGSGKAGWFLGVGDPIYNTADPRWQPAEITPQIKRAWAFPGLWTRASEADGASQLSRLVASASEIQSSAQSWSTGSATAVLLTGKDARRERFLDLVPRRPAILHLATHVLTPAGRSGEALLAFGLGAEARTEFLTTSDVAALRVPGALVVMTGCGTGKGEARAGTGLLGLTRAWQMAGADGVLATSWAVKDSSGEVFTSFYRHLRSVPAAEALRRSQTEMIHSNTWRAAPAYWASYQLTGGAH